MSSNKFILIPTYLLGSCISLPLEADKPFEYLTVCHSIDKQFVVYASYKLKLCWCKLDAIFSIESLHCLIRQVVDVIVLFLEEIQTFS